MSKQNPGVKSPLQSLLDDFRRAAVTEREKGTYFEQLVVLYLRNEPRYKDLYDKVWMYADWASEVGGEYGFDGRDTGIDLVAREAATGEFHAIQCKFFAPQHKVQKSDIDSFFTASGRRPFTRRMIVVSTNNWSEHAESALSNQTPPVMTISLWDLEESLIDWSAYKPKQAAVLRPRKQPLPHQLVALEKVRAGFKSADRGKLIMACGTGKTFTSLRVAEELVGRGGRVLFMVPSLALLSQALNEWSQEASLGLHAFAVCSDAEIGKKRSQDDERVETFAHELSYPATTHAKALAQAIDRKQDKQHMTVVFSTYHSIDVVSQAQKKHALAEFDLIICDEAHRTTGATFEGEDESAFVRVHDNRQIQGAKRLYMTATPRIFGNAAKATAEELTIQLASMDDEALYGKELYTISFSEAVSRELLVDYKVIVLAVDEAHVNRRLQKLLADETNELKVDDAARIIGCWKALSKVKLDPLDDPEPMRRAVAFCQRIEPVRGKRAVASKLIAQMFQAVVEEYQKNEPDARGVTCAVQHIDGGMQAFEKEDKLRWLKEPADANTCRILSNVRCLSEGVDVPALDAVLFLTPRQSQVDVVQSVGRVMRRAPGKKRGYVILPVVIPAGVEPHEALNDNQTYKVVWQVLQALRAHDDRFDAMINKMDLVGPDTSKIEIVTVSERLPARRENLSSEQKLRGRARGGQNIGRAEAPTKSKDEQQLIEFEIGEMERAIYARIVKKVGNPRHWEEWAYDIGKIANTHIDRIKAILEDKANVAEKKAFHDFAEELRDDLNEQVSDEEIIEMLAQHMITKPVFDALFANYSFAKENPVSRGLDKVLQSLARHHIEKEADTLQKFYDSVRLRAAGIESAEARQKIVLELYDKFFRGAFTKLTERLGIVYTPVEIVDFINRSVEEILQAEFGASLAQDKVHIIDPFTGTGTFITRLLQSGLIPHDRLEYKYKNEIHANEMVLLAYYIAAINIESVYHSLRGEAPPDPLEGEAPPGPLKGEGTPRPPQGGGHPPTPLKGGTQTGGRYRNEIIPYNPALRMRSRELRKNMTPGERVLWQEIRNRSLGWQFHRQVPIFEYIVDFYCHELKLAIEVDGSSHDSDEAQARDAVRQAHLESLGVRFVRVREEEVHADLPGAIEKIRQAIAATPQGPGSPLRGEGGVAPAAGVDTPSPSKGYTPFPGICFTDTFQLFEKDDMISRVLVDNSDRRKRQQSLDIRVIVGNPPYSAGQSSANDNNQNVKYPKLDARIAETYAKYTVATNKNALYDSYIRALRWASDRLHGQGVIGFVTNAGWIDSNSADGLRKCLAEEFSKIYVFHLRGNQRTEGELSRKEGGKIFGGASRAPIAISFFVKSHHHKGQAEIYFCDIGDYLSREEKLEKIRTLGSVGGISRAGLWQKIVPDKYNDWLNQRDDSFGKFLVLGAKKEKGENALFENYSNGLKSNRDVWVYNFSRKALEKNMRTTIDFYNSELARWLRAKNKGDVKKFVHYDSTRICWIRPTLQSLEKNKSSLFSKNYVMSALYRPFIKQYIYFDPFWADQIYQIPRIFPTPAAENRVICVTGRGSTKDFSCIMTDIIPDLELISKSQCFPLYLYDTPNPSKGGHPGELFGRSGKARRRYAITDAGLKYFREGLLHPLTPSRGDLGNPSRGDTPGPLKGGSKAPLEGGVGGVNPPTHEDVFYYVYGLLHSGEYRQKYANNLAKELPRIPRLKSPDAFWAFAEAGRKLAELHVHYEKQKRYPLKYATRSTLKDTDYRIEKLRYKSKEDKTAIVVNAQLTLEGIPPEAHDYVVNGKSALDWIVERYGIKTDKDSGIVNDANAWALETEKNPRYIVELIERVVTVSLETMKIVKGLPKLDIQPN